MTQHEPWLVALDIDGTLMTYNEEFSDDVREAITAVQDAGHHVVLASGRSLLGVKLAAEQLKVSDLAFVASNGAVMGQLDSTNAKGYVIDQVETFDPEPALRLLRKHLPQAKYGVEDIGVGFHLTDYFPDGELVGVHKIVDFEDLCSQEVTRVVVRELDHEYEKIDALMPVIGLKDVTFVVGWSAWIDIGPQGVTKAAALERIRQGRSVPPWRTLAVGDGNNDIEMLRWAARGVAMGHASESVLTAADEVTLGIEADGAVPVLQSLL